MDKVKFIFEKGIKPYILSGYSFKLEKVQHPEYFNTNRLPQNRKNFEMLHY